MTEPKRARTNPLHLIEDTYGEAAAEGFCGMAHFAGTGPEGETCRTCAHWTPDSGRHSYVTGIKQIKPCRCAKFAQLMRGKLGGVIPHFARACRYFMPADDPPPPFNPKS
jgi:hypothetical protein